MAAEDDILEKFARALIDKRFADARTLLAPWLRDEMDDASLEASIEQALAAAGEQAGVENVPWPTEISLDSNDLDVNELRQNTPSLSKSITEKNYRGWHCLQFDPDSDAPFDLWVALVADESGNLQLGHLDFAEAD